MNAAIFDVDRTILDGMSGYYFSAWLWKSRFMPVMGRLRTARSLILYRLKLRPETEMVEVGVTALAGLSPESVAPLADRCVEELLVPKIYREAAAKIEEHNAAGDFTVLASGSAQPIVDALARKLGARCAVGTRALIGEDGKYLAKPDLPLCYKDGKTELVARELKAKNLRLEDAYFYTDNSPDIPMLKLVARPFAVNPEAALREMAAASGWPILEWKTCFSGDLVSGGTRWPLH
jgi:HAD superfamily hydrolase (TIGR01490 family)